MLKYIVAHFTRQVSGKIGCFYQRVLNLWHVFLKYEYLRHNGIVSNRVAPKNMSSFPKNMHSTRFYIYINTFIYFSSKLTQTDKKNKTVLSFFFMEKWGSTSNLLFQPLSVGNPPLKKFGHQGLWAKAGVFVPPQERCRGRSQNVNKD